jgi:predicted dienelactone hydrolase
MNRTSAACSLSLFRSLSRAAQFLSSLCLTTLIPFVQVFPAAAAERVTLTYGFAEISTSVRSLQNYAERGEIDDELAPYLNYLNEVQRSQFRSALQARPNIGPVSLSQLLYSSIGNYFLSALGDIVRTPSRRNGAQGLRSALVLAAAEPGGLSLVEVLEKFPGDTVRIDSPRIFQAINGFTRLSNDTRLAMTAIEQLAVSVDSSEASLLNLAEHGAYDVTVDLFTLVDEERDGAAFQRNRAAFQRNRTLTVDLYLPEYLPDSSNELQVLSPVPLIVISHGLSDTRKSLAFIAQHLASHGFAVAALDHPGSDFLQFEALLKGFVDEMASPNEFSDRPRDISFLLDELTRLNSDSNSLIFNRLEMEKIGVVGHSFGGYTVLALAGAQPNFDNLSANCGSTEFLLNAANASMLLQCSALGAPEQFSANLSANLKDERIKAVIAMNPVTSSLFGPTGFSGLAIPSLLVAGSADPLAPALLEQIRPFMWQAEGEGDSQHYLAVIKGGSHLYEVPGLTTNPRLVSSLVSSDMALSSDYLKALSLGFMQMTLAGSAAYQAQPQAAYQADYEQLFPSRPIVRLGQDSLPLYVINTLNEEMLTMPEASANSSVQ